MLSSTALTGVPGSRRVDPAYGTLLGSRERTAGWLPSMFSWHVLDFASCGAGSGQVCAPVEPVDCERRLHVADWALPSCSRVGTNPWLAASAAAQAALSQVTLAELNRAQQAQRAHFYLKTDSLQRGVAYRGTDPRTYRLAAKIIRGENTAAGEGSGGCGVVGAGSHAFGGLITLPTCKDWQAPGLSSSH